jgi:uncharacterized phage protein (TIGR01671 family)
LKQREILFRGKRIDNGEWVYGNLNYGTIGIKSIKDSYYISDFDVNPWDKKFYPVIHESVGQYTGLTDKNGKKIFENDICRFDNDEPNEAERYTNYVLRWDIVNCRFVVVTADNCEDVLDRFFSENSEIIANLHDNPELLEVGE